MSKKEGIYSHSLTCQRMWYEDRDARIDAADTCVCPECPLLYHGAMCVYLISRDDIWCNCYPEQKKRREELLAAKK